MTQPTATTLRLDARALKVLAHPLRSRLLTALRTDGPATATALAARASGPTPARPATTCANSPRSGLVEETGEGHGRERWWRAATEMHGWTERDVAGDPDGRGRQRLAPPPLPPNVHRALRGVARHARPTGRSNGRTSPAPPTTRSASPLPGWPHSRPSSRRWCERYRARAPDDPDAEAVQVHLHVFPLPTDDRMSALEARSARRRLPRPDRSALAADRAADPGHRPARALAWPVADRDRPHLQHPGPRRPRPRAADRRALRRARSPADPDPGQPRRARLPRAALRRRLGGAVRRLDGAAGRLSGARQRTARGVVRRRDARRRARRRDRAGPERAAAPSSASRSRSAPCCRAGSSRSIRSTRSRPSPCRSSSRSASVCVNLVAIIAAHERGPAGARRWRRSPARSGPCRGRSPTASVCCARRGSCSRSSPSSCSGASRWSPSRASSRSACPRSSATLDQAAALMGPVSSVAWFASAAGAAADRPGEQPHRGRALGGVHCASCRALTIVAMGLLAGPVGVVIAYLACYVAHGASNPMHMTLLHRQVDGPHRATVLSMNSMISAAGRGARGDRSSRPWPTGPRSRRPWSSAASSAPLAAPLYIPAWRAERAARRPRSNSRAVPRR